ncbi:MAG: hypothetical protein LBK22_09905 [Tannerella sp.]|jgi:1,6-anhydro-N-acetylmuramate kinase|nr:hypothetical protein [Tannerella sp.]
MKPEYCVPGLMPGTSLDGLDMALCRFAKTDGRWTYHKITPREVQAFRHEIYLKLSAPAVHSSFFLLPLHRIAFCLP